MGRANYKLREVFTPAKVATVTFVERSEINELLDSSLLTPGKQVIVYGFSGSGKTTLIRNKLDKIYEHQVITRCVKGMTFNQIILDAFDQLSPYYIEQTSKTDDIAGSVKAQFFVIKSGIEAKHGSGSNNSRYLPPQLTPQTLGRLLGEGKFCWLLEDFHKIEGDDKLGIAQTMKVFMDMGSDYLELKIIALGAVGTAREVVNCEREMRNRVAEIHVPLMNDKELKAIIRKGEDALNITFNADVKSGVVQYANGLPAVCHDLCLKMCEFSKIIDTAEISRTIGKDQLPKALDAYIKEASDSLKEVFDKALKQEQPDDIDHYREILVALAGLSPDGDVLVSVLKKVHDRYPYYRAEDLERFLEILQTDEHGATVRFDSASGRYYFSDPFYRVYCSVVLKLGTVYVPARYPDDQGERKNEPRASVPAAPSVHTPKILGDDIYSEYSKEFLEKIVVDMGMSLESAEFQRILSNDDSKGTWYKRFANSKKQKKRKK